MRPERDVVLGDRYVLVERIAVGAMGEVWEATDRVLGRPVAVKILKEELRTASTFLARFRAEARHAGGLSHPGIATVYDYARHAGGLSHPGIATVYDYGETADLAFLVMELVRGKPLSELMAQQPSLPAWAKLSVLGQTAEALAAAHDAGVVHRDVKPGNLMVRRDGTVKVTDFGIARARASAPLTETGQTIGTPTYVAPEQAVGGTATGASDVYSLGVVAYELFAGRPPFERDTPLALAYAHVNEAPPPLPPSVPARVAALIESALAKDPSRRPPIASFAAQLREEMAAVQPARSREPSHDASAPDGGIDRAVPRASAAARLPTVAAPVAATRRYRRRFSVAVAGFVGLLVILGATMWAATRPSRTDEALTDPVASTITGSSVETPSRARPPAAAPPVTDTPAAAPPATAPATQPTATQPPATQPPATQPPATQPPSTRAPATQPPATAQPSDRTVPARAATGGGVAESEALAFVVDYYERLAAGDYEATWEALSPEFRDARDLTFEDYVAYWRNTALDLGDLRFVPGPGGDQGRVRFEARYTTATRVIDETDEITLRRHPDGSLIITEQRIV